MKTTPRIARIASKLIAGFVAAGILAGGAAAIAPAPEAAAATMSQAQKTSIERKVEAELVKLTNTTRARVGLKPLKVDYLLTTSTRAWSKVMSSKNSMFHSTTYPFPARTESAGENVLRAPVSATAAQMQAAWEASPTHWANLAAKRYGYVGFGAEIDDRGNIWVTAHFLGDVNGDYKPKSAPSTKAVAGSKVSASKAATARTAFTKKLSAQKKAVATAKATSKKLAKKATKSAKVRKAVAALKSYESYVSKHTPKVTSKTAVKTVKKNTSTVKAQTTKLNKLIKAAQKA
ncbi:CAP domain-containing protein [Galactobacter valiniphilus]|uniref:CAP domain-containing protein n=1 Tax=Galactobacter valiniphilus TaxID=2676122 RepID=UPI00373546D7